jgi:hypothetical protein
MPDITRIIDDEIAKIQKCSKVCDEIRTRINRDGNFEVSGRYAQDAHYLLVEAVIKLELQKREVAENLDKLQ